MVRDTARHSLGRWFIASLRRDPIGTARRIKGVLLHDERGGRVAQFACHFGPSQESGRPYMDQTCPRFPDAFKFTQNCRCVQRLPAFRSVTLTA